MAYLFKEKLNLLELAGMEKRLMKIALAMGDEYLRDIYRLQLSRHDFVVLACHPGQNLSERLLSFRPHALIISVEDLGRDHEMLKTLSALRRQHPSLAMVTIGFNIPGELLSKIMSTGAASHIDRRLGRPQDVVHVIKAILNY